LLTSALHNALWLCLHCEQIGWDSVGCGWVQPSGWQHVVAVVLGCRKALVITVWNASLPVRTKRLLKCLWELHSWHKLWAVFSLDALAFDGHEHWQFKFTNE